MSPTRTKASEHIIAVAAARARVLRIEDELDTVKANLKLAKTEFNNVCRELSEYASEQLKFDLGPST